MRTLLCLVTLLCAASAAGKPKPKNDAERKKILKQKIIQNSGMLRAIMDSQGGALQSAFGDGGFSKQLARVNKAYEAANRAYERGAWAEAVEGYRKAWALDDKRSLGGGRAYQTRLGLACEALGRVQCAVQSARDHRNARGVLGRGLGGLRSHRDPKRLEKALPDLIKRRARALEEEDPQARAKLYEKLLSRDPRCMGDRCPPFLLSEAGAAYHAVGRFPRSIELLERYLKAMPKAKDRGAVKRMLKSARAAEKSADRAQKADVKARQLKLPIGSSKPAPWLSLGTWPNGRFEHLRDGGSVGVARMRVGKQTRWLGVRHGEAAVGPLAIPDTFKWLAVSQQGGVYSADADGTLFHAADLDAAQRPFAKLTTLKNITHWDLSGQTIVASGGQVVQVSIDGGRSFVAHAHSSALGKAWARADGTVAFGDKTGAWISRDGGKTWQNTPLGDMRRLRRDGQRIYLEPVGPNSFYDRQMNCAQGDLTADGQWVATEDEYVRRPENGWKTVFAIGNFARSPRAVPDGLGRPATQKGTPALPVVQRCMADPKAWFEANRGGAGGMGGRGMSCRGLDCLIRTSLPATPVRFGLLGDARCGESTRPPALNLVPANRSSRPRWMAKRAPVGCDAVTTSGTLFQISSKAITPRAPIKNCALRWVRSVGGVGIGMCRQDGGPELVVLDAKGGLRERQPLGGPLEHLMLASDGTLVAQVGVDGQHVAWIRRPTALGSPGAWRRQSMTDAAAWRAAPGGRAVAILPGKVASPRFENTRNLRNDRWMQRPSKETVDAWQACHQAAFEKNPRLQGSATIIRTVDAGRVVQSVRIDNAVQGADAEFVQCLLAAAQAAPVPFGKAGELKHMLRFEVDLSSYRLALAQLDGTTLPLTADIPFDAPPKQFEVQADGTVQVKHNAWPERTCLVPTRGKALCPREK
jgi:tetratricopeptide (TPR) repeat protein